MDFLHPLFLEYAQSYKKAIHQIRRLEVDTGISAINGQFVNNIRHSVEHQSLAILHASAESPNQDEAEKHMKEAIFHINHLATDGFEHIAGIYLRKLTDSILDAGFFTQCKEAKRLRQEAIKHFTQGRNKRTDEPDQAISHCSQVIKISNEGFAAIKPITRLDRFTLFFRIFGLLATIAALILFLDRFYHFLPSVSP